MKQRIPDYFDTFSCLAGACPHSCCIGWEVVLDEDTVQRYQELPGPLGDRLRAAMAFDGEDFCFPLNGGRCPFLNNENLCDIHCALGAEATSVTCREHPRFIEEYGPFREITLSAACPKANELLLGSDAPLTFLEREDGEAEEEGDEWLDWLVPLRDRLLDLLRDRSQTLAVRLERFLLTAAEAQELLDQEDWAGLSELEIASEAADADVEAPPLLTGAVEFLLGLDILEPDWRRLLAQAGTAPEPCAADGQLERVAVYAAFRYVLKTVNDGDLLGRAKLCVLAVVLLRHLSGICGLSEALRLFSREIEHDEDNLDALLDAFQIEDAFSLEAFLAALKWEE